MDDRRFDQVTKIMGSGRSRRAALKALAGGALGAAVAGVAAPAMAQKPTGQERCLGNQPCSDTRCFCEQKLCYRCPKGYGYNPAVNRCRCLTKNCRLGQLTDKIPCQKA